MAEPRAGNADVAFSGGRPGNPKRRQPHRARSAGGAVCGRRQNRRRFPARPLHPHHPNPAAAHQSEKLGQTVPIPIQIRRLLLQYPPAARPPLGHRPAGYRARCRFRRDPAARLRHVQLPHQRARPLLHRSCRRRRAIQRRRTRQPITQHRHDPDGRRLRQFRRAVFGYGRQPGFAVAENAGAAAARVRQARSGAGKLHR